MQKTVISVPTMFADHHVLRVREALLGLSGVSKVVASSARKQVAVAYDDSVLSPDRIAQALVDAGYPPNEELPILGQHHQSEDGSPWYTVLQRVTTTEMKDLEMSGDFRRY
jgi:copper chaperone CopZ